MPYQALRPCAEPGCPVLVKSGRCAEHTVYPSALGWRSDATRIRGRALQRLRTELYSREPFCRTCHVGLTMRLNCGNSMIRDHIVPLAEGGTDDPANIQALCRRCSDIKTHGESLRGRGGI